jgi:hypothetical protein
VALPTRTRQLQKQVLEDGGFVNDKLENYCILRNKSVDNQGYSIHDELSYTSPIDPQSRAPTKIFVPVYLEWRSIRRIEECDVFYLEQAMELHPNS